MEVIPKLKIISIIVLSWIFVYLFIFRSDNKSAMDYLVQPIDLTNNALYKTYDFSSDEKVIDFGEQPLWSPTSLITTLMKRDRVFQQQLAEIGYKIKMHPFFKGDDLNYFFNSGYLEAGVVGDAPALKVATSGNAKFVSMVQKGFLSLVSRDILEVQDLKAKRIAYPFGSNAHYYLLHLLQDNNIKIKDISLIPMDVIVMSNALANKQIDAFVAWEPTPTIALTEHPTFKITNRSKSYGFLYVNKDLFLNHQEVVKILIAAELRALNWIREDEENLLQTSKWAIDSGLRLDPKLSAINPSQLAEIAQEDLPGIYIQEYPTIDPQLLEKDGELYNEFIYLQELNLIPKGIKWEEDSNSFDLKIIKDVVNNIDKYLLFRYKY